MNAEKPPFEVLRLDHVVLAVQDACRRLLAPAMETEMRLDSKKRADEAAIKVFTDNLRELLLAPPLGQRAVMAIDGDPTTAWRVDDHGDPVGARGQAHLADVEHMAGRRAAQQRVGRERRLSFRHAHGVVAVVFLQFLDVPEM